MTPKVNVTTKEGCCISCGRNGILFKVPVMRGTQWRWRCKLCIDNRTARNKELRNAKAGKP